MFYSNKKLICYVLYYYRYSQFSQVKDDEVHKYLDSAFNYSKENENYLN